MRLAHLSDLHVIDGPRLDDHRDTLHRIVDAILVAKPDVVLLTGDLAGRTVPHRTTPRERGVLYPELVRLAQVAPVVALYGNHDQEPDMDRLVDLDGQWPIMVMKAAGEQQINTRSGPLFLYWLAYPTKRWLLAGEDATGLAATQLRVQEKLSMLCQLWGHKIRRRRQQHPGVPHVFAGHLQIGGSRTSGGEVLAGQEIELQRDDLAGLGVDYGALGHIHLRQEMAPRCWYAGSTWRNDFGETEPYKGWTLVDVGDDTGWPDEPMLTQGEPGAWGGNYYRDDDEAADVRVLAMPSDCRRFVTLDYRWGDDAPAPQDGVGWHANPWLHSAADSKALAESIKGAEVRMRLVVPQHSVASCPWEAELAKVRQLGAHRIQPERVIEPTLRVRAPGVAAADTLDAKVRAYWDVLGTTPTDDEKAAALAQLAELQGMEDEQIEAVRQLLITAANEEADDVEHTAAV